MNAGMYGMPDGQGGVPQRKFAGRFAPSAKSEIATLLGTTPAAFGYTTPSLINPVQNVRTLIASFSGKGAIRWFQLRNGPSSGSATITGEMIIDGVSSRQSLLVSANAGLLIVGAVAPTASDSIAIPDYIPFEKTLEIYVTASNVSPSVAPFFVVDIHQ